MGTTEKDLLERLSRDAATMRRQALAVPEPEEEEDDEEERALLERLGSDAARARREVSMGGLANTMAAFGQTAIEQAGQAIAQPGRDWRAGRLSVARAGEAAQEGDWLGVARELLPDTDTDLGQPDVDPTGLRGLRKFGGELLTLPYVLAAFGAETIRGRGPLESTAAETDAIRREAGAATQGEVAGERISEWAREAIATDPTREDDFATQVARGAASLVPLAASVGLTRRLPVRGAPGAGTRAGVRQAAALGMGDEALKGLSRVDRLGVRMASMAPALASGVSSLEAEAYNAARMAGESDEVALQAGTQAGALGLLEGLSFGQILERTLGKPVIGRLGRQAIDALRTGGINAAEEAVTESLQQIGQNDLARQLYNPSQELVEGLRESTEVGGAVGFLASVVLSSLGMRRARQLSLPDEQGNAVFQVGDERSGQVFEAPAGARGSFARPDRTLQDQGTRVLREYARLTEEERGEVDRQVAARLAERGDRLMVEERGPIYVTVRQDSRDDEFRRKTLRDVSGVPNAQWGARPPTPYQARVVRQPDGRFTTPDGIEVDPSKVYQIDTESGGTVPLPESLLSRGTDTQGTTKQAPIVAAAIRYRDGSRIGRGPNHFLAALDAGLTDDPDQWPIHLIQQGFVDSDGNFWTREETAARTGRAGESGAQGLSVQEGGPAYGDPLVTLEADLEAAVEADPRVLEMASRMGPQAQTRAEKILTDLRRKGLGSQEARWHRSFYEVEADTELGDYAGPSRPYRNLLGLSPEGEPGYHQVVGQPHPNEKTAANGGKAAVFIHRDENGVLDGYLMIEQIPGEVGTALDVFVRPDKQRQGIGTELYRRAAEVGYDVEAASDRAASGDGIMSVEGMAFREGRRQKQMAEYDRVGVSEPKAIAAESLEILGIFLTSKRMRRFNADRLAARIATITTPEEAQVVADEEIFEPILDIPGVGHDELMAGDMAAMNIFDRLGVIDISTINRLQSGNRVDGSGNLATLEGLRRDVRGQRDRVVMAEPSAEVAKANATSEAKIAHGSVEKAAAIAREIVEQFGEEANVSINGLPSTLERWRALPAPEAIKDAWVSIWGKTMKTADDVARLMAPFRDPRMEHFHVIMLDDAGRVVHHMVETSGSASMVAITARERSATWAAIKDETGAKTMMVVHNHPSGAVTPSTADIVGFEQLRQHMEIFGIDLKASWVINHDEISEIRVGKPSSKDPDAPPVPTVKKHEIDPEKPHDWTQLVDETWVANHEVVADLVQQGPEKGKFFVLYLDTQLRTLAAQPFDLSILTQDGVHDWFASRAAALGSSRMMIVSNDSYTPGSFKALSDMGRRLNRAHPLMAVEDVIDLAPDGRLRVSAREQGSDILGFDVAQAQAYNAAVENLPSELEAFEAGGDLMVNRGEVGGEAQVFVAQEEPAAYGSERAQDHKSPDPLVRVAALLRAGAAQQELTRLDVTRALLAARNPEILESLQKFAPKGRGAFRSERWLADVMETDPKHAKKVRSPFEIIIRLAQQTGVPIEQQGGKRKWAILRRKGVEGAYRIGTRMIRLNNPGDIEAAAHEVGHFVHELVYGVARTKAGKVKGLKLDALTPEEIVELEQIAGQVSGGGATEGIAEFFRRFVTNPEAALQQAPKYHASVTERLEKEHPAVMEALLSARHDFHEWRTASDVARLKSMISHIEDVQAIFIKDRWLRFKTIMLHNLEPLREAEEAVQKDNTDITKSAHAMALIRRGIKGAAEYMMKYGMIDFNQQPTGGKSLEDILAPIFRGGQRDDFTAYIVARRGIERMTKVRKRDDDGNPTLVGYDVGFTLETARNVVAELETDEFRAAFDELVEYNLGLLRYLRDAGVVSRETYDRILANSKDYVPFSRVIKEGQGGAGGTTKVITSNKVLKRFKGDTTPIIDPLESMMMNTYLYTQAAAQQRIGMALIGLADQEGAGKYLDLIQPANRVQKRRFEDIWDEINAKTGGSLGEIPAEAREEIAMMFSPGDFFGSPNTISVRKPDGKLAWYEVRDQDLYDALVGNDNRISDFWNFVAQPARWLRAGATLNPEFIFRNPARDQLTAWMQSEYGYRPGIDLGFGMFNLLFHKERNILGVKLPANKQAEKLYRLWKTGGGEFAALVDLDRAAMQKNLKDLISSGSMVPNVIRHPIAFLQAFSALMENGTRMGEFRRAMLKQMERDGFDVSRGVWPADLSQVDQATRQIRDRAVLASREITTDFARHGALNAAWRSIATFWNAGIQGDDRFWRQAFQKNPRAMAMKAFLGITVPSILLYAVNRDDEEYFEIPQWQRDLFWVMKIPTTLVPSFAQQTEDSGALGQFLKPFISSKDGVWVRIPKPFGPGQIFGSIPERMMEWMDKADPGAMDETMRQILFNFYGGVPDVVAIQPFIENWANRSRFLKRPVVPQSQVELDPAEQYGPRTSEFAKGLARFLAPLEGAPIIGDVAEGAGLLSPAKLDNIFRAYTAGLGQYVLQAANPLLAPITSPDEEVGKRPARTLADVPGAKAFFVREPGFGSESISDFYDAYLDARQKHLTFESMKRSGNASRALRYHRENRAAIIEYGRLESYANGLQAYRAMARAVEESRTLSPQQKAAELERIGDLATALAAGALGRDERATTLDPVLEPVAEAVRAVFPPYGD